MANHVGGVWERQIRSARTILSSLIRIHSMSLDENSRSNLFAEVEAIVNSRPMVVQRINDVNSEVAIKSKVFLLLVYLVNQICIAEGHGRGSSTSIMNLESLTKRNSGDFPRET